MRHAFIDNYANLDSPIRRIPIKIKIISIFVLLLAIVLTPLRLSIISFYCGLIFLLIYLSRIKLSFLLLRIAEAIPFIFFISILNLFRKNGQIIFINYFIKALLAITAVIIFSASTKFGVLLEGLRGLGCPRQIIMPLSFMYRYVFLLEDHFLRTKRAYESRAGFRKSRLFQFRVLSNIIGVLFIRTYERAERVYLAMCARGFSSEKGS
jgi:cobalt/nickel transport system permease protein